MNSFSGLIKNVGDYFNTEASGATNLYNKVGGFLGGVNNMAAGVTSPASPSLAANGGQHGLLPVPNSNQSSSVAPLSTRASVATPAQLSSGTSAPANPGSTGSTGGAGGSNGGGAAGGSTQAPQTNPLAPNNNSFGGAVGTVMQTASQPTPGFIQAQNDYNTAENELQQSKEGQAGQSFENLNNPIPAFAKGGRENSINSSAAFQQAAEAATMNAAANEQGIQTGQQSTQLGGQETAASMVAPTPANIYGMYQPDKGLVQGYNSGTAESPNTNGIATGAELQGTAALAQSLPANQNSFDMATGISDNFSNWLKNNPNAVNSSNVNLVNELMNWAQGGQFSDPQYPELNQFLNEYLNTASSLVGSPGLPTNYKQSIVDSMINPTSSTGSIQDQINNLNSLMATKLNTTYKNVGTTPPDNISRYISGGSSGNTSGGGSSGGSTGNTFGSFSGGQ